MRSQGCRVTYSLSDLLDLQLVARRTTESDDYLVLDFLSHVCYS